MTSSFLDNSFTAEYGARQLDLSFKKESTFINENRDVIDKKEWRT